MAEIPLSPICGLSRDRRELIGPDEGGTGIVDVKKRKYDLVRRLLLCTTGSFVTVVGFCAEDFLLSFLR